MIQANWPATGIHVITHCTSTSR